MKVPKWLKILLWLLTLSAITLLVILRRTEVFSWFPDAYDTYLIIIWVVLMLFPLLSEVEFFGIKFKREIDNLKSDMNIKFNELKTDIKLNQTMNFNVNTLAPPPSDEALKNQIEKIKSDTTISNDNIPMDLNNIPNDNINLFKIRYNIEKELNRIWEGRFKGDYNLSNNSRQSIIQKLKILDKYDLIHQGLLPILRDILSICNYAIHGEQITESQLEFVNSYYNKVIKDLKDID